MRDKIALKVDKIEDSKNPKKQGVTDRGKITLNSFTYCKGKISTCQLHGVENK